MDKNKIKILLIDDEPDILEIVRFNLSNEGYQVFTEKDGASGIATAKKVLPDLIITDIMMDKMDGIEVCERIRDTSELSDCLLVFLTARGEDYSLMAGFNAGADDYITKPIKPKLLISKIKSLLRRIYKQDETSNNQKIELGDILIDFENYKVFKKKKEINLPRKEFELFALLTSRPGKVFRREEILKDVWGKKIIVGDRTIDVHIRKLREKVGKKRITTIKGVGYKFEN